jgi:hypothetical protein
VNSTGEHPQKQANGPWAFIGGSVGELFGASDPDHPEKGPKFAQHLRRAAQLGAQPRLRCDGDQQLKTDDYIYYDSDVVPAVAWILS